MFDIGHNRPCQPVDPVVPGTPETRERDQTASEHRTDPGRLEEDNALWQAAMDHAALRLAWTAARRTGRRREADAINNKCAAAAARNGIGPRENTAIATNAVSGGHTQTAGHVDRPGTRQAIGVAAFVAEG